MRGTGGIVVLLWGFLDWRSAKDGLKMRCIHLPRISLRALTSVDRFAVPCKLIHPQTMSPELPLPPLYLLNLWGLFHHEYFSQYYTPSPKLPGDSIDAAERSIIWFDDVLEELNSAYPAPNTYWAQSPVPAFYEWSKEDWLPKSPTGVVIIGAEYFDTSVVFFDTPVALTHLPVEQSARSWVEAQAIVDSLPEPGQSKRQSRSWKTVPIAFDGCSPVL